MERDGHDRVDFAGPSRCLLGHHRAERGAELASAVVLEALNRVGNGTAVLEDGAGAGYTFEEDGAGSAEGRSAFRRFVATGAATGGDQIEEALKEISHTTVSVHCDRGCGRTGTDANTDSDTGTVPALVVVRLPPQYRKRAIDLLGQEQPR